MGLLSSAMKDLFRIGNGRGFRAELAGSPNAMGEHIQADP